MREPPKRDDGMGSWWCRVCWLLAGPRATALGCPDSARTARLPNRLVWSGGNGDRIGPDGLPVNNAEEISGGWSLSENWLPWREDGTPCEAPPALQEGDVVEFLVATAGHGTVTVAYDRIPEAVWVQFESDPEAQARVLTENLRLVRRNEDTARRAWEGSEFSSSAAEAAFWDAVEAVE